MVKRQVTQLTRLVDDLLDVSRITQGRIELKREPLDLADIIHQALETAEPLFRERQHEVSVTSSLQRAARQRRHDSPGTEFVNVLTNSAKYTDHGGVIRVQTRADGTNALVEISDNGAGISAELLAAGVRALRAGRPYSGPVPRRTRHRSVGGQAARGDARRQESPHRSAGSGRGSTFRFWLPLIEPPATASRDVSTVGRSPARVLIVDDNVDAADSLALVLKLDGHTTESVYSASSALERVGPFGPDIVLLDIGLPEMDGYEVARRIRARPGLATPRLVALTGYGQSEDLRRARDAGFDDHLVKPVDLAMLERCLNGISSGTLARRRP